MKKYIIIGIIFFLSFVTEGCNKEVDVEETIYYSSWLDGQWQSTSVEYCFNPLRKSPEEADSLIGKIYDFSMPWEADVVGGALPVRNVNTQFFFWPQFPYYMSELGIEGNYYAIIEFNEDDSVVSPTLIPKDENEMLITEYLTGVYYVQRVEDSTNLQQHAYDKELTFQENIKARMETQGITYESYYQDVWGGNWTIEEVVFAEDMQKAESYIGTEVSYIRGTDCFDLEFPDSPEDKIFYGMPTVEKLGLDGNYYIIVWDAENEFPAAIVKSEHEMFLIRENMVFRAVQEETYLNEWQLQAF